MKKRMRLSSVPPPFVITPALQKIYDGWIEYFINMSPRIRVCNPNEEGFDFKKFETTAKEFARRDYDIEEVLLNDWPEQKDVAFIVCYDSAPPWHPKKEFLDKDIRIFCLDGRAFGIGYFERDGENDEDKYSHYYTYGLQGFPLSSLSWKYVAGLIKSELIAIEAALPPLPE